MILVSLFVAAALSVVEAQPASADAYGGLRTSQNNCLYVHWDYGVIGDGGDRGCLELDTHRWGLEIVAYVGDSPRYRVRNLENNQCLVALASSGRVDTYRCNSEWADQVWAFQYVKTDPSDGLPRFWLRNKHSGRCLALNLSYYPEAFMTGCADYRDQLWKAPGT